MLETLPAPLFGQLRRTSPVRQVGRMATNRRRAVLPCIYRAQGGRCGLCGGPIISLNDATLEHVFPRYYGFFNVGNMIVAHDLCNRRKGGGRPTGCGLIWLQIANTTLAQTDHGFCYGAPIAGE